MSHLSSSCVSVFETERKRGSPKVIQGPFCSNLCTTNKAYPVQRDAVHLAATRDVWSHSSNRNWVRSLFMLCGQINLLLCQTHTPSGAEVPNYSLMTGFSLLWETIQMPALFWELNKDTQSTQVTSAYWFSPSQAEQGHSFSVETYYEVADYFPIPTIRWEILYQKNLQRGSRIESRCLQKTAHTPHAPASKTLCSLCAHVA